MKKYFFVIIAIFTIFACESSQNYSVQIDNQRKQIKEYIADHNLTLIYEYPADSIFKSNEYLWLSEDSIVFRLTQKGLGDTVKAGDRLYVRWVRYSLDGKDSVSYWNTGDLSYPLEIIYDPNPNSTSNYNRTNTNCMGWQSAIRMMKRSDAIADFIVPSPIGTLDAFNEVKAYRYKFTFKILPK